MFFCPFSSVFKTYRVIGNLCAQCLDQVGKVIKTPGEVNVLVSIAGYRWTLNAHCLRHAPGETLTPGSDCELYQQFLSCQTFPWCNVYATALIQLL